MDPTQTNYRESLQEAIDAEIKSLEESIQVLKLRRNALQPISSFPPEIFAAIFSFLCLPGIPSLGIKLAKNQERLSISHVSHRWREIALNQPQLWSHLDFSTISMSGAAEILVRAKSVPLYIHDDDRFGHFLKEVQGRLPYIRHLSICAGFVGIHWRLKNTLVSPAPTLEYLSLICRREEYWSAGLGAQHLQVLLDPVFGGSTPKLSCLKVRYCNISWNSQLLKGLKHLEILLPYEGTRPTLTDWLDTLDEIPQLKTLTLHRASPVAVHFPFDVERTVTLPFLTHLDISASLPDCALAIAHLVLPTLASLCLAAFDHLITSNRVQEFLRYATQHAHGPQDTQPLQSVLIRNRASYLELLAWPVPDIDTLVYDPPAFLGTIFPTRVKLFLKSEGHDRVELFGTMMAALPLGALLTIAAVNLDLPQGHSLLSRDLTMQQFWLGLLPNWPLLRRARLAPITSRGFIQALLENCKNPLLPSLTELVLADTPLYANWTDCLRDLLMKRVEQGVPLESLDLRMCRTDTDNLVAVRLLSEIVVDVLRPLDFLGSKGTEDSGDAGLVTFTEMRTMWEPLRPNPLSKDDDSDDEDSDI